MSHWLFQGNPKYYRLLEAIAQLDEIPWLVTRYNKEIQVGDGVLVWIAGEQAGIYAIAEIIEPPQIPIEISDLDYWIAIDNAKKDKPRVKLRFLRKLLGQPLRRNEIKYDPILKDLLVIRAPNSTNFKVTTQQWERVYQLKG
ncbi:EVE domain-containing protein [Candidatus Gracilibacteria bacterium]|nr:EVE domain-containing protein [Candidatus Gracilibacteria bacterium]NJM87381.1 EVE domain-containing protein [Hydrococcus sp. RU_2_2]NJP19048.1 EVE domain-containing protein [Hydrococcus sp. CRU_1_1]